MICIKKYQESDEQQWNNFVATAKNSTFLFNRNFMDYHSNRFTDHSLLIFKDQVLKAVFVANEKDKVIYAHAGLTYGGLVIQDDLYTTDCIKIFKQILIYYESDKFTEIQLKSIPYFFVNQPADEVDYLAFICQAQLFRRDLHSVINLKNPYRISKSVPRDCRLVDSKFIFKETQDFAAFWNNLLIPNLLESHQTSPVHSLSEILNLKQNFPDQIKFFGCYFNEELIGGVVIFETEFVAHCQYISGTKLFNKLRGLSFLLQNVIHHYTNAKAYFNFGISNINSGKNINEGLILWKEKFGARSVSQSFYKFQTNSHYLINDVLV